MTIFGMTLSGGLFALTTTALFAWGLYIGLKGAFADAPAFKQGGHAPGAAGTFDPRCTACGPDHKAA
jgi:hypothetical protein